MSWGRGFFRLWLVISALWLALWGGLWWKLEVHPDSIPQATQWDPYFHHFDSKADPRHQPCLSAEGVTQSGDLRTAAAQTRYLRCRAHIDMWRSRIEFLVFGLTPPIVLLMFGLLLAWVLAGFRRRPAV